MLYLVCRRNNIVSIENIQVYLTAIKRYIIFKIREETLKTSQII
jgi:hypothetical protein